MKRYWVNYQLSVTTVSCKIKPGSNSNT